MSNVSFQYYFTKLTATPRREHIRAGQHAFNILADIDKEVADKIRGSQFDPFHHDDNLPPFLIKVAELLDAVDEETVCDHEPDWASLTCCYDGEAYIDVKCVKCGAGGTLGSTDALIDRITWDGE